MINGKNFFDQPIKNDIKTYENIRAIATGQGDAYVTVFFARLQLFQKTL